MIDTQRLQKNMRKVKPYFTFIKVLITPKKIARFKMQKIYSKYYLSATTAQKEDIDQRVAYYNKIKFKKTHTTYNITGLGVLKKAIPGHIM